MCLAFIGYEGSAGHVKAQRKLVGAIVKAHGGLCIGSGPGALYDQKKFDTPYIRDYLLDRGALGDVSETAAPWSALRGALRRGDRGGGARDRRAGRRRLRDVPPVALLPLRRVPLLHVRLQPVGDARRARRVRRGQGRDPAGVRRFRRDALAPPCGRDRARALARAGHLPGRGGAAAGAVRRRRSRGRTSTRGRSPARRASASRTPDQRHGAQGTIRADRPVRARDGSWISSVGPGWGLVGCGRTGTLRSTAAAGPRRVSA